MQRSLRFEAVKICISTGQDRQGKNRTTIRGKLDPTAIPPMRDPRRRLGQHERGRDEKHPPTRRKGYKK